jgi:hypothetical protein
MTTYEFILEISTAALFGLYFYSITREFPWLPTSLMPPLLAAATASATLSRRICWSSSPPWCSSTILGGRRPDRQYESILQVAIISSDRHQYFFSRVSFVVLSCKIIYFYFTGFLTA